MISVVILLSMLVVVVVYMLFCLMFYKNMVDMENTSPYECGFDPYSLTRLMFSYRFYLISILFIIFDVEISLMLPTPFLIGSSVGFIIFVIFVAIMVIGLLYEYNYGSLDWLWS